MAYSSLGQWRLAQEYTAHSAQPAVGLPPFVGSASWMAWAFSPSAQLRTFSPNASTRVPRGSLSQTAGEFLLSASNIQALIDSAKAEVHRLHAFLGRFMHAHCLNWLFLWRMQLLYNAAEEPQEGRAVNPRAFG